MSEVLVIAIVILAVGIAIGTLIGKKTAINAYATEFANATCDNKRLNSTIQKNAVQIVQLEENIESMSASALDEQSERRKENTAHFQELKRTRDEIDGLRHALKLEQTARKRDREEHQNEDDMNEARYAYVLAIHRLESSVLSALLVAHIKDEDRWILSALERQRCLSLSDIVPEDIWNNALLEYERDLDRQISCFDKSPDKTVRALLETEGAFKKEHQDETLENFRLAATLIGGADEQTFNNAREAAVNRFLEKHST